MEGERERERYFLFRPKVVDGSPHESWHFVAHVHPVVWREEMHGGTCLHRTCTAAHGGPAARTKVANVRTLNGDTDSPIRDPYGALGAGLRRADDKTDRINEPDERLSSKP